LRPRAKSTQEEHGDTRPNQLSLALFAVGDFGFEGIGPNPQFGALPIHQRFFKLANFICPERPRPLQQF
jgi:hypothetical protein